MTSAEHNPYESPADELSGGEVWQHADGGIRREFRSGLWNGIAAIMVLATLFVVPAMAILTASALALFVWPVIGAATLVLLILLDRSRRS